MDKQIHQELTQCVEYIDRTFCHYLREIQHIESIFAIGSMVSDNYRIKKYNDYDIRVFAHQLSDDIYGSVHNALNDCCQHLSVQYPDIQIGVSEVIGPARITSMDCCCSLLIHCIILTEDSFQQLPVMHRISYSKNYRIIFGTNIFNNCTDLVLTLDGIMNDDEGIMYCLDYLKKMKYRYLYWAKDGADSYHIVSAEKQLSNEMAFEFANYSIDKSTDNLVAFFRQINRPKTASFILQMKRKNVPAFNYEEFLEKSAEIINGTLLYLEQLKLFVNEWRSKNETS